MDSTEGIVVLEETKIYEELEGRIGENDDEEAQITEEKFTIVKGEMDEEMIKKFFATKTDIWGLPINENDDDDDDDEAMPDLISTEDEIVKLKRICDDCKEENGNCKCDKTMTLCDKQ